MASFFKTTFDNLVHNINTTLNKTNTRQPRQPSGQTNNQSRTSHNYSGHNSSAPNRHHTRQHTNYPTGRQAYSNNPTSSQRTFQTSNPTTRQATNNSTTNGDMNRNNSNLASNINGPTVITANEKIDISDVRDPNDINNLSAKQLKIILTRNCVDYKGVFEKEVLREKVMQLWIDCNQEKESRRVKNHQSNHRSQSDDLDDVDDSQACKICMDRPINCVLLECGHMLTCVTCGKKLAECPICRQNVTRCVRIFKG